MKIQFGEKWQVESNDCGWQINQLGKVGEKAKRKENIDKPFSKPMYYYPSLEATMRGLLDLKFNREPGFQDLSIDSVDKIIRAIDRAKDEMLESVKDIKQGVGK